MNDSFRPQIFAFFLALLSTFCPAAAQEPAVFSIVSADARTNKSLSAGGEIDLRWQCMLTVTHPGISTQRPQESVANSFTQVQVAGPGEFAYDYLLNQTWFVTYAAEAVFVLNQQTPFENGSYTFSITDTEGNTRSETVDYVRHDHTMPVPDSHTYYPVDTAVIDEMTPTFSWTPLEYDQGPVSYRLNLYDEANPRLQYVSPEIESTTFTLPSGILTACHGYRYKIIAYSTSTHHLKSVGNKCRFSLACHGSTRFAFERLWPALQQPWYFKPSSVAVSPDGNVYVADYNDDTLKKFNASGQLVTVYGKSHGSAPHPNGWVPFAVAVDGSGNVYVVDIRGHQIHCFSREDAYLHSWGEKGTGAGQFVFVDDIDGDNQADVFEGYLAVDRLGSVYVSDVGNHRVQKFDGEGNFISQWGGQGTGAGEFDWPAGIAVDERGDVYVVDEKNNRIQKFDPDGGFVTQWGGPGAAPGQFDFTSEAGSSGIAVDEKNHVYVSDGGNFRIQKFSATGEFLAQWQSKWEWSDDDGDLRYPMGLASDGRGHIFEADFGLDRIQKFTSDGQFLTCWGAAGQADGKLSGPAGIVLDDNGDIYVSDAGNGRIQKFSSDGRFLAQWDDPGTPDKWFFTPSGMAMGADGSLYTADLNFNRILQFSPSGEPLNNWGQEGTAEGEFNFSFLNTDLAVDSSGSVYVMDACNHRVQKFSAGGDFIRAWGVQGSGEGEFQTCSDAWGGTDIAVDQDDHVYVADFGNDRIQVFSPDGQFLRMMGQDSGMVSPQGICVDSDGFVYVVGDNNEILQLAPDGTLAGRFFQGGSAPGQLRNPMDIARADNGSVYVADSFNHRIQKFRAATTDSSAKAIIVAGGGPYPGDRLWDATRMSAYLAYWALVNQGFHKGRICYLISETDLDLDGNGEYDDVAGDARNSNLQDAIFTWAADASRLFVYLVDHGSSGEFWMEKAIGEKLNAADLDNWLDDWQDITGGQVVVIYDACYSGSFVNLLVPPAGSDRICVTSTSPEQEAYFIQGSISFSNDFWTHIFNGLDVAEAFTQAKSAMAAYQNALMDANGNGIGNEDEDYALAQSVFIGNGTAGHGDRPVIGSVSEEQTIDGTSSATIRAENVHDDDGIDRVWAVIRPPGYTPAGSDNPVVELPAMDLSPNPEIPGRYENTDDGFHGAGTYHIAVYARDRIGNTATPVLTRVHVGNPIRRRAILVAGGQPSDTLWPLIENNIKLAWEALHFQGYGSDDIRLMSPVSIPGVDETIYGPTPDNLRYAVEEWAYTDTHDVVLYLIGAGGDAAFHLSETETLDADLLDGWLDGLQENQVDRVTLIYDASQSGSFLNRLVPPEGKERILITSCSAGQGALFLPDGNVSFSSIFWREISKGWDVMDAFLAAKRDIETLSPRDRYGVTLHAPLLDDNGDGTYDSKKDGGLAWKTMLGAGIVPAGNDPIIGAVCPDRILSGETAALLWAGNIATTGAIEKVYAVITPPQGFQDTSPGAVSDLPGTGTRLQRHQPTI